VESFKLRVRIEPRAFEFEAEGERETVERQFVSFQEFVRTTPMVHSPERQRALGAGTEADDDAEETPPPPPPGDENAGAGEQQGGVWAADAAEFRKIFVPDGPVVYLSAPPHAASGAPDLERSGLLLLLGFRLYKNEESVSGKQLMDGLNKSGFSVLRADRVLDPYMGGSDAAVMRFGKKRGVRYRLTNKGLTLARTYAREVASMVT
jgi:hypothetical protein